MIKTKKSFIAVYKSSKGELLIEFLPELFSFRKIAKFLIKGFLSVLLKIFLPIFAVFDYLATKKQLVLASIGLGIGLGLSVLITQRPDALFAFPYTATSDQSLISVSKLVIDKIDLSVSVSKGSAQDLFDSFASNGVVHDQRSSGLGLNGVIVLLDGGLGGVLTDLEQVQIGDSIELTGSNKAQYRFKVTEIRTLDSEYLPNVIGLYDRALIIYKPVNILRTRLHILIAQPVSSL